MIEGIDSTFTPTSHHGAEECSYASPHIQVSVRRTESLRYPSRESLRCTYSETRMMGQTNRLLWTHPLKTTRPHVCVRASVLLSMCLFCVISIRYLACIHVPAAETHPRVSVECRVGWGPAGSSRRNTPSQNGEAPPRGTWGEGWPPPFLIRT